MSDDQQTLGNSPQDNEQLQLAQDPSGPSEPHQRPQSVSYQFEFRNGIRTDQSCTCFFRVY